MQKLANHLNWKSFFFAICYVYKIVNFKNKKFKNPISNRQRNGKMTYFLTFAQLFLRPVQQNDQ